MEKDKVTLHADCTEDTGDFPVDINETLKNFLEESELSVKITLGEYRQLVSDTAEYFTVNKYLRERVKELQASNEALKAELADVKGTLSGKVKVVLLKIARKIFIVVPALLSIYILTEFMHEKAGDPSRLCVLFLRGCRTSRRTAGQPCPRRSPVPCLF